MSNKDHRPPRVSAMELTILAAFALSLCAAVAFAVTYWLGGQTQLEGTFAAVGLGSVALGLGLWANAEIGAPQHTQEREPLPSTDVDRRSFVEDFSRGEQMLVRRRLVLALAGSSLVVGAATALFPLRSLGPRPDDELRTTGWRRGVRLVDEDGAAVRPTQLPVGSALTVYPDGEVGSASSQAVLINYGQAAFRPADGRTTWTVDTCVAYSRVCTHAGCPVGVYQAESHQLMCPCHQSLFDVLDGAAPRFGPASRPLPQLPLAIDADGYLVSQGDFDEPVGPGFWNR